MAYNSRQNILGVLGGMGPLASAEFLKTIYEHSLGEREQDSPVVMLYSDPRFPDRTEEFLNGSYDLLLSMLTDALQRLCDMGISRVVICCMTIHYLLPRLPRDLRERVVSLLDIIFANMSESRHLLLCTKGTRKLGLFQSHGQWDMVKDRIVLADEEDQNLIHDLIYSTKKNHNLNDMFPVLESLLGKYEVNHFIAGCTEMHLLAKHFIRSKNGDNEYCCVDPLAIIAEEMARDGNADRAQSVRAGEVELTGAI